MNAHWTRVFALAVFALIPLAANANEPAAKSVDFAREVLPILSDKCFVCHGPDGVAKDDVRLDSFAEATRDLGDGRRAIAPTALDKSELLLRIRSTDDPMPPEDAEKQLTDSERDVLSRWVRQGGRYATHWAFVPPQKDHDGAAAEAIDALIEEKLKKRGVALAPQAERATLARRAALVLTGLPPAPEMLDAFIKDQSADAYDKFVDRLLASPRYGEHQARYWLDAVRYGDTHGLHLDNRRGIFPYRDWVVQAFNRNLPLDDFIQWQLAGDLLPNPSLEQLVATGFVRMNPTTAEGGAIPAEFQAKNNFDRVETLGTVFLGMTLTCARCHSHKYDPVSHTEYYELMAFFNSTAESSMDGNKYEYGPVARAPSDVAAWRQWRSQQTQREQLIAAITAKLETRETPKLRQKWAAANSDEKMKLAVSEAFQTELAELGAQAMTLQSEIEAARKAYTTTLVAKDLPRPRVTKVLDRGEYNLPVGDALTPGVLKVMGQLPTAAPRNRLGLAKWLTSPEHPLVSRVLVNRIWQRVFGDGLVRTPEDFGLQGEQPTHPELLDWLAVELVESEWDLKHMLRAMVRSRVFRQTSARRDDLEDAQNRLFSRGPSHRLDAEVIRDIGLWASGLLDPSMGGEGVKPYQPKGLWSALMHPASNTKKYVADTGSKLYRRSLYVYWKRTSPHPMMTLFDAPSRESSCVRRSRTNTSLQSLGLLNETQRMEIARKLAERILLAKPKDEERLDELFRLLASRTPSAKERAACQGLLDAMKQRYRNDAAAVTEVLSHGSAARDESLDLVEHAAWTQLAITVLASDLAIALY